MWKENRWQRLFQAHQVLQCRDREAKARPSRKLVRHGDFSEPLTRRALQRRNPLLAASPQMMGMAPAIVDLHFVAMVGVFHRANRPRMVLGPGDDRITPALGLRFLEEMVANPRASIAARVGCCPDTPVSGSRASKNPGQRLVQAHAQPRRVAAGLRSIAGRAQYANASQSM